MFVILCPALSMGLIAEEKDMGTIEMLLTLPVRDSQVVLGKFLAAVGVLAIGLLLTLPMPITIAFIGPLDKGPVIAGYLGALLLGATYLSVGLLASSTTKSQVIAFVVGWAACLVLILTGMLVSSVGPHFGQVLAYLSPQTHFSKIGRGVVELRDAVYFLTIIGAMLLLSLQAMESRKWR